MTAPVWTISKVTVSDFLGFQGSRKFSFDAGVQVIEAPNHTGKTSLTLAILWCLTGEVPGLARINKKSFRLFNKHKGDNADTWVELLLKQEGGSTELRITRQYIKAIPDLERDLSVEYDGQAMTGQEAQGFILQQLQLKPHSLEGCGVVLQDQRLQLINGKSSAISDVINDMLGLYTLSQLAPVLDEQGKAAKDLGKEIKNFMEVADPLVRWTEKQESLQADLQKTENAALEAGFAAEELEAPNDTATKQLCEVAMDLQLDDDFRKALPELGHDEQVELLRKELAGLRTSSPAMREVNELDRRSRLLQEAAKQGEHVNESLREHLEGLTTESNRGEMDRATLGRDIAACDTVLQRNAARQEELSGEQEFAQAAYKHLLAHRELTECPLCGAAAELQELIDKTTERIESSIAEELQRINAEEKEKTGEKQAAEKRLEQLEQLDEEHRLVLSKVEALSKELDALASEPGPVPAGLGTPIAELLDPKKLFTDSAAQQALVTAIDSALKSTAAVVIVLQDLHKTKLDEKNRVEAEQYQPADKRINRVQDHLRKVIDLHGRIEEHGQLREKAESDQSDLNKLLNESKDFTSRLKKITKELNEHELQAASAAINQQMPTITEVFQGVAQNPDYDGLEVKTKVSRDKVQYELMATSSQMGNLNDDVGHVLSEGDLSAAGIALLLGLAMGKQHRLGFMVLDDPAQGMDPTLQENFASVLCKMTDLKQVLVLTHQPDFAASLAKAGAKRILWGRWKGGRIEEA